MSFTIFIEEFYLLAITIILIFTKRKKNKEITINVNKSHKHQSQSELFVYIWYYKPIQLPSHHSVIFSLFILREREIKIRYLIIIKLFVFVLFVIFWFITKIMRAPYYFHGMLSNTIKIILCHTVTTLSSLRDSMWYMGPTMYVRCKGIM